MNRREWLLIGLFTLILGFVLMRGCDKKKDLSTVSTQLAPNIVEKIVVNPDTHKLTIITKTKQQDLFLPDRPSSIEIDKEGKAVVTSRQFGTEIKPFGGVGYADKFRLYIGVDLGYWKKLDGGLFLSGGPSASIHLGGSVSYTVWSNTRVSLGLDNAKDVNLFLSWRF